MTTQQQSSHPRRHHYVSKFYLAAWTDDGTADGKLHVIDKSLGATRSARPKEVAHQRDLYMIDTSEVIDDLSALEIEDFFGRVETAAGPVVRDILEGKAMPSGDGRDSLMLFFATLALRVPGHLKLIDELLRAPMKAALRSLDAEGKLPLPEDPILAAKMREWFDRGLIRIEIKQNPRLAMMFAGLAPLNELLARRAWTVLRAGAGAGDLICTDRPVLLEWLGAGPEGYSPGFGLEKTAVFVPLGPSVILLGLWNAEPADKTLTETRVSYLNGELLGNVTRFVFSRGDFSALHPSGAIDRREDVLRRWAKRATRDSTARAKGS